MALIINTNHTKPVQVVNFFTFFKGAFAPYGVCGGV